MARPNMYELLRENGRRELRRRLVAVVALSPEELHVFDEAQRVPANLTQHVDLIIIVERQYHFLEPSHLILYVHVDVL